MRIMVLKFKPRRNNITTSALSEADDLDIDAGNRHLTLAKVKDGLTSPARIIDTGNLTAPPPQIPPPSLPARRRAR
jgi:hypothetical protein